MRKSKSTTEKAAVRKIFLTHHGFLRASEALEEGLQSRQLLSLTDSGTLEQLSRGLFRLKDLPPLKDRNLFIIGAKIPQSVLCLNSALAFHKLIQKIPKEYCMALIKGGQKPRLETPPVKFFWISDPAFSEGIEIHKIDQIDLKVYSPEKTIANCFKFRNQIGIDLCLEALKNWLTNTNKKPEKLSKYAKICRVENVMKPYLDALK